MKRSFLVSHADQEEATPLLYLPGGSPYHPSRDSVTGDDKEGRPEKIIVNGDFPQHQNESGVLIETIRDSQNTDRLMFLRWEKGNVTILHHVERNGRKYLPPDPSAASFPQLSLPDGLLPCGGPAELSAEISSLISQFIRLRREYCLIAGAIVLASWFPDCFDAAPYLWVVGPLGSAKTKLLKLLSCLCRRGLIAGDLRSGSLYKLMDTWNPTLLIDELDLGNSGSNVELLRLLRNGSVPGVPTFRNSQAYSTYGLKIITSRQPLRDAALLSRGVLISLLPDENEIAPLNEGAMKWITKEYQAKLLMFRLQNHAAVMNSTMPLNALHGLSPRTKEIARALSAPFQEDPVGSAELITILVNFDKESRIERALEPEWLVAEALFDLVHEGMESGRLVTDILIGGVATRVNQNLKNHGEDFKLSARRVGAVVKSLGLRTDRLGRLGRGLKLTSSMRRRVHEIARHLSIDRTTIATIMGLEAGYGGPPCAICDEFGLTGDLRFVELNNLARRSLRPSWSRPPVVHKTAHD